MRILHTTPSLDPKLGGPTEVVLHLVSALRRLGVDAEIATTNDRGKEMFDVPLRKRVMYRGVPVWFFPRTELRYHQFIVAPEYREFLEQHLRSYDLLDNHYLFTYSSLMAARVARTQGVPYTVRAMGQLAPWSLGHRAWKKRLYLKFFEQENLERAAAIHCTSEGERDDVLAVVPNAKTILLPLGVSAPGSNPNAPRSLRTRLRIPLDRQIVLYLSRLHPKKRPDLLLESLRHIPAPAPHILIAGSGTPRYERYLRTLVDRLGVGDRVTFLGHIEGEEKTESLLGSDLFVLPSHSENFGIAVAEALAAGLPVVLTPGVQIADAIVAYAAGAVSDPDPESLGKAIASLLRSPVTHERCRENARRLALEEYSWDTIAAKLKDAYARILGEHSGTPRKL